MRRGEKWNEMKCVEFILSSEFLSRRRGKFLCILGISINNGTCFCKNEEIFFVLFLLLKRWAKQYKSGWGRMACSFPFHIKTIISFHPSSLNLAIIHYNSKSSTNKNCRRQLGAVSFIMQPPSRTWCWCFLCELSSLTVIWLDE